MDSQLQIHLDRSPALRLGFVVATFPLAYRFAEVAACLAPPPWSSAQLATAQFMREGHYMRHLRRLKRVYSTQRDALLNCLAQRAIETTTAGLAVLVRCAGCGYRERNARVRIGACAALAFSETVAAICFSSWASLNASGDKVLRMMYVAMDFLHRNECLPFYRPGQTHDVCFSGPRRVHLPPIDYRFVTRRSLYRRQASFFIGRRRSLLPCVVRVMAGPRVRPPRNGAGFSSMGDLRERGTGFITRPVRSGKCACRPLPQFRANWNDVRPGALSFFEKLLRAIVGLDGALPASYCRLTLRSTRRRQRWRR